MRRTILILAIAAALISTAAARRAAPPLAFVGALTSADFDKGRPWYDARFKGALARALQPKSPIQRLYLGGPVTSPPAKVDGAVQLWGCRAHDCAAIQANIFVQPAQNRLFVCWHDEEKDPAHDWWLADDGAAPAPLEPGVCGKDDTALSVWKDRRPG